jgi:hypothetical protein
MTTLDLSKHLGSSVGRACRLNQIIMTVFYAGSSVQNKTKQRTSCFDFFLVHQLFHGQKYFRCKCLFNMHINNTKISVLTSLYQILTIIFLTP